MCVTWHESNGKCHLPPVTCHLQPVTILARDLNFLHNVQHLSSVKFYMSHVTCFFLVFFVEKLVELVCGGSAHHCFGPPFLLLGGLLSTGASVDFLHSNLKIGPFGPPPPRSLRVKD